jgi:mono/diheme cytochrome c family protein
VSRVPASLVLLALGGALSGTACMRLTFSDDPHAAALRYPHRVTDTCSSWLQSHVTGYRYCASPRIDLALGGPVAAAPSTTGGAAAASFTSVAQGATDVDSLRKHGESVYANVCAACHQASGEGVPGAFPPLVGAGGYYGDPKNHARIVVHGLSGPIVVNGTQWNGAMPPQGHLSDYDIAAVATYERTSWGNADGAVMPADVASAR